MCVKFLRKKNKLVYFLFIFVVLVFTVKSAYMRWCAWVYRCHRFFCTSMVCLYACWHLITYTWIVCRLSTHRTHYSRTQTHARQTDYAHLIQNNSNRSQSNHCDWINVPRVCACVCVCVCTLMPVCHLCIYKFLPNQITQHQSTYTQSTQKIRPTSTYATLFECTEAHFRIINSTCILTCIAH